MDNKNNKKREEFKKKKQSLPSKMSLIVLGIVCIGRGLHKRNGHAVMQRIEGSTMSECYTYNEDSIP